MALPRDDEECRKRITALALAAEPSVLIDNVAAGAVVGFSSLDAALTATSWGDRILGFSTVATGIPLYITWYLTGNNVVLGADTSRRTLQIRLESPLERPEERTGFRHPRLLDWVRAERPRLAAAAVTILAAYCDAGRPDMGLTPWGSFEGWSDLVRQGIVWAGQSDPAETRVELRNQADRGVAALRRLLTSWEEVDPNGAGVTVADVLAMLAESPGRFDAIRGALLELCPPKDGKTFNARSVGQKFHHVRHRVIDGRFLDSRDSNRGAVWVVQGADEGDNASDSRGNSDSSFHPSRVHVRNNRTMVPNTVTVPTTVTPGNGHCQHSNIEETPTFDGYVNRQCRDCGQPLTCRKVEGGE
jgi:hypothetical protein